MRSLDGLPTVAIVGRPNVGKSTLFNRIVGRRVALVHDVAGVTRDRNYARAEWEDREFWIVDTGGLLLHERHGIELEIRQQVEAAIAEADAVILVLDAHVGLTADDVEVVRSLLKTGKPLVIAANKADDTAKALQASSIVAGGAGAAMPVAAASGLGVAELLDEVVKALPPPAEGPPAEDDVVCVAIVGRPNVGKSSLVNAILGEPKMIVSPIAGTTRDAIDTPLIFEGQRYRLIDTAGLRRKSRVKGVEYWSTLRTVRAIERSDVAALVLDATQEISEQDVKVAAEAVDAFKSVIVVANKWDAVEKDPDVARRYEDRLSWHFKFLPDAPILYVSALTGRRVARILPEAARLAEIRRRRVPTSVLNETLRKLLAEHPPPSARSARITRVYYATQVAVSPPTFAVFTNRPENLDGHYTRFLRNRFKEEFGFEGAHVKVVVRKRESAE